MREILTPGSEFTPDDGFVVNGFAAYAATASPGPDRLATPIVMLDLEGYRQSDLPVPEGGTLPIHHLRLIFERDGAVKTVEGMLNSIGILDAVARSQEDS